MQTHKNQLEGAEHISTVPTNVTSIVAQRAAEIKNITVYNKYRHTKMLAAPYLLHVYP